MKTLIFISSLFLTTIVFGQGTSVDTTKKAHNNIISVDATGLLRQFFNFNQNSYYPYSAYLLTYRRVIKNNAIKLAIGGDINKDSGTSNDSLKNTATRSNFSLALGIEHYQYLSKRFTFYYGVDATTKYLNSISKTSRTTTAYYASKNESNSYGLSANLGIVFHITTRINISTETSYNLSYEQSTSSATEFPYSQYDRKSTGNSIQSTFFPPTSLNFRFKF